METVDSSCQQLEKELHPETILIELVDESISESVLEDLLSDDQGIGLSSSNSSDSSDSREDLVSAIGFESAEQDSSFIDEEQIDQLFNEDELLIAHLVSGIMALDLRKKTEVAVQEVDCKSELSDDDNTTVALDLSRPSTSRELPPAPPLIPIANMMLQQQQQQLANNPLKQLQPVERTYLCEAYDALVRFLRLGPSSGRIRSPELFHITALKRLQSYLYLYMNELKRNSPAPLGIFQKTFSDNKSIRDFFHLFAGASRLQRSASSAFTAVNRGPLISGAGGNSSSVLRSGRLEGPLQVMSRGPTHDHRHIRTIGLNNTAPYQLRRSDSAGSNGSNYSSRSGSQQHQMLTHSYSNLAASNNTPYYNTPSINHAQGGTAQQLPFAWKPNNGPRHQPTQQPINVTETPIYTEVLSVFFLFTIT